MLKRRFSHPLVAVLVLVSMLCQGTMVLAGTTGSMSGVVVAADQSGTTSPLAGAKVSVVSPSQSASTTTDGGGHFSFISLAPDTYTVSVEKQGYESTSQSGINIFADQSQTLNLSTRRQLREIGRITTRSTTDLVKPGTTADVYSINATQQQAFQGVGGGGGLNNAYSAIATIPGVYVPLNQNGWFQTIHIRGGDYDQVGYEVDGVPVNRAFDNYPSGTASSLGQQELQVYTGAAPANAEGQGLAGFINQVIRTGTYPGFANLNLSVGGPAYYHKASFEVGGASPNRNFSYYVGVGGYNQDLRYVTQQQGAGTPDQYGALVSQDFNVNCATAAIRNSYSNCYANNVATTGLPIAPNGFLVTNQVFGNASTLVNRDTVVNLHFGFPHKNDGAKDDLQILYVNNFLRTQSYSSANDLGIANLNNATGLNAIPIVDAYGFNAPTGQFLPANYQALTAPYYLPFTPGSRPFAAGAGFASVPSTFLSLNDRDSNQNNQGLVKLQYQKNFGSNAYLRVYGYSGYSDWLINGQNYTFLSLNTFLGGNPYDYELSTHTRGLSGTFADQINAQNLIQFQGSFTTASVIRDNNTQPINAFSGSRQRFAVAVDSTNPTNGFCYRASGAPGPATPAYCSQFAAGGVRATYATLPQAYAGTIPNISGSTCGGGPCAFYVAENGQYATFNQVKPNFVAFSLSDTFKPNDRLTLNFGLRFDSFQYKGASTAGTAARTLFFNAANMDYCLDATGLRTGKTLAQLAAGTSCAALGLRPLNLVNVPADNQYPVWQPRLGFTYSLSPDSVIRGSYGRYAQAPNSAFEQYNTLYQDLPNFLTTAFTKFGFNSPGHRVVPETSNNFDVSLEHHFKGTDTSFKLTPFYRVTQNQIQTFFLDQPSNFVSGLNANSLTSRGLEFQLNKGDFGRDGFAMQLAFTYTNAYAKYYSFANGNTIFTGINTDIQNYNGFTSFCGTNPGDARCTGTAANAVPCFTAAGAAAPGCPAGSIANPYFNAPVQGLVDPKGQYVPFSLVTAGIGAASNSYLTPYVSTLVVQYKKGAWAFTPSLQFQGGQRYGAPETTPGIDPTGGCGALATGVSGDPRYPYGAPGGSPFDAPTCNATLVIPNPLTRQFDPIGSFVAPNQLVANMQISYKASKNVTFRATMANIMSTCFGGSNVPWNNGGSQVCGFGYVSSGNAVPFYGNVFNPGSSVQPIVQYPYQRYYGAFNTDGNSTKQPFSIFFDAQIKF